MSLTKKKKIWLTILIVFLVLVLIIGIVLGIALQPKDRNVLRAERLEHLETDSVRAPKGGVVFLGDSITHLYDVDDFYTDYKVYNRGISGDTTYDILARLQSTCLIMEPKIINLLIGINDKATPDVAGRIAEILNQIYAANPNTMVVVQSVYPVDHNSNDGKRRRFRGATTNEEIIALNVLIKALCEQYKNCAYFDVYSHLTDETGNFSEELSNDGLHPNKAGYQAITALMKPTIDRLCMECGII